MQNYIYAVDADGKECTMIFTPLAPYEKPMAVDAICKEFNHAIAAGEVDQLILIPPLFTHDFLCIHPFSDGNDVRKIVRARNGAQSRPQPNR